MTVHFILIFQNVVNTCWEEMEPGDVQIDYSSNVDEAFQVEKESRRESRAIEIQVTRMNFRHRMKSRNVFHYWAHSLCDVGDTCSWKRQLEKNEKLESQT